MESLQFESFSLLVSSGVVYRGLQSSPMRKSEAAHHEVHEIIHVGKPVAPRFKDIGFDRNTSRHCFLSDAFMVTLHRELAKFCIDRQITECFEAA